MKDNQIQEQTSPNNAGVDTSVDSNALQCKYCKGTTWTSAGYCRGCGRPASHSG
ncbi:hypothetical protein H072_11144 [Dactylellina haptotyla CBS 200.50]|uniref:Uncharacterized protein n=1 Tax=Dactylellina haptotyla (strain CBS 200.50) TaxID=1284197 RepID=S8A2S4_DACHA|nr:hypothetical protein H072_11144 [Dactylellina haptotyla CBS 200.50]